MPTHLQRRTLLPPEAQNPARFATPAADLASINLSPSDPSDYPLKTLPRPTGEARHRHRTSTAAQRRDATRRRRIRTDWSGIRISAANIWARSIPRSARSSITVPTWKPDEPKALLDVEFDTDGNIWVGMMLQADIATFDRTTLV